MSLHTRATLRVAITCAVLCIMLLLSVPLCAQVNADFTPSKSSDCESLITKFNDNSGGDPVSWQWNLGNGFTSSEQSPSASYTTPGTYQVTLTVKNAAGNTSSVTKSVTVWAKPLPDFTVSPAKGCIPLDVTFTDKSNPVSGTISAYTWDFGDGATGSGSHPVHTYNNVLSPTVTLTITTSNGCTASKQLNNIVNVSDALTANFNVSDKFLCTAPGALTITNSSTGPGNLSYKWDFGDGGTSASANPGTHNYTTKGVYKVKLTVTSDKGCISTKTSDDINVANFKTDFTLPASICDNNTATFTANTTPQTNSITWSVDKGYIYDYDATAAYYPAGAGTVKVSMTADYDKCHQTITKDYVVKASPKAEFVTSQAAICDVPATIKLTNQSTDASIWAWDFGDGQISTLQNPTVVYNTLGYFNIKLTASNANGCASYVAHQVNVVKPEVRVYTSVPNGCVGLTPSFSSSISTGDAIVSYEWDFGDGTPKSTDPTPSHTYTREGTFPVNLTYVTSNGCKGTVPLTSYLVIEIYKKPVPDFSSPEAPQICGNNWVHFNGTSDVASTWTWNFGDGTIAEHSVQNVTHSYREPGTYTVKLTVSNNGCYETVTKTAYITAVNPFPRFSRQNIDCENRTTASFDEHSLGTINSWKWSWGDGKENTYTTKTSPVKHKYDKTGDYLVKLTVTDGTCTSTDSMIASILAPTPITITADKSTLCTNESLMANVTSIDTKLYELNYTWSSSDGKSYYGTFNTIFQNLAPGKDTIRFIAYNRQYCIDTSNSVVVNVHGPMAKFRSPTTPECRGTELTFTDQTDVSKGKAIKTWSWDFGGDNATKVFSAPPFKYTYNRSGYYFPRLTVTDLDGCTSTFTGDYLQVNGPNADFVPSASLIPPGGDVYFYNYTTETGGNASYQWDFGDNTTSTDVNPYKNYPNKGLYTVNLLVKDNNGCSDSAQKQIKVSSVSAGFTATTTFVNNSGCPPVIASFTNTSVNYISSYWDFGDGSFSTIPNPSHTYTYAGKYKVTLKVMGDAGTEDQYEQELEVKGPYATIATSSNGGCLTKEIEFRVSATAAVNFAWDFTDGFVMETTDSIIKHTFKEPGIYKPRLILSDQSGCKGTAFLDEPIVIDNLKIELASTPAYVCDEGWVAFTPKFNSYSIDTLKTTAKYKWTYDGTMRSEKDTTAAPRFYLDKIQAYNFTLTTTTAYGCVQTVSKTVHAYPKPVVSISGPLQGCQDAPVTFNGTVTKVSDVSWRWAFGNGNSSEVQQAADQTYTKTGPTEVVLTVISQDGCSDTARHNINILPKPAVTTTATSTVVCLGNTSTLTATGGVTYQWSPAGELSNPQAASPVAMPTQSTDYQVTVTDANNCSNTGDISIRVALPFTIQATPDTAICLGHVLPLWVGGADHYVWQGEGLDNVNTAAPRATLTALGDYTYQVTGYDADGCFTHDTSLVVSVHPTPTINAGADRVVMAGTPVRLSGEGSADIVQWNWSPPEYLNCTTCATPEALPNLSTNYMVEVENSFGCKATDDVFVKVTCDQGAIFLPNAFTPNRDGKNEWFYPKGRGVKEVKWMRIYDRWGSLVFERNHFPINSSTAGWDGTWKNQIAPIGTYVYALETMCEDGTTFLFRGVVTVVR